MAVWGPLACCYAGRCCDPWIDDLKKEHIRRYLQMENNSNTNSAADTTSTASASSKENVNTTQYILPPLDTIVHLVDRKYHGDECHVVFNLPVGKHVVVITTNEVPASHAHPLSHLITW